MGKVTLKTAADQPIRAAGSTGKGLVLRSEQTEVARIFFEEGGGAAAHSHDSEETLFVEQGRIEVTLGSGEGEETYVVERGQGSFHPPRTSHRVRALEDSWVVCFKNIVSEPTYPADGRLD